MSEFDALNSDPAVKALIAGIEKYRSRVGNAYRSLLTGMAQAHHLAPLEGLRTKTG